MSEWIPNNGVSGCSAVAAGFLEIRVRVGQVPSRGRGRRRGAARR
jgi:hypothetical protein